MTLPGPAPAPVPAPAPAPVPAPAPPPATPPSIPSPGPPRTLRLARGDGQRIRVSWPSGHRTVAPASTVRVRISQPRRGERKLTVSLLRVSAKGRILGVVQRTGVARGTVSVVIPDTAGRRYSLRLLRGGKRLRSLTIRTPAAGPSVATPVPAPPPRTEVLLPKDGNMAPVLPTCTVDGPAVGRIEAPASPVVAGEWATISVLNDGDSCLAMLGTVTVERQADEGGWTPVPVGVALRSLVPGAYPGFFPGTRDRVLFGLLDDALAGTYRATVEIATLRPPGHEGPFTGQTATLVSETFAVVAAP